MFSRKSANVLSKDSGATSPSDAPPSTAAVGSVLNSGLSFALMEERACVSLLHKLSGTHLEAMKHFMHWANDQRSPLFAVIYAKVAEVAWMWNQIIKETADKYAEYIKLLHEVFSEERAIEEIHKAAGIAQQHVTRAQKNLDASRKKSDSPKQAAMQKDVETAKGNYGMLSQKLLQQLSSVEALQLKNVRQGLAAQSSSYLTMAEHCRKLFTTQQQLVDMIPTDHSLLMDEDVIKGIECSMNECIFGLAEDLDLWPPEGGGVMSAEGTHAEQNGHELRLSTASMSSTLSQEGDVKLTAQYGSHECLSSAMPPALPPRSPMTGRRTEKLKESNADTDVRSRCRSLSFRDRKGKKGDTKKQETMPEVPPEKDYVTVDDHYETVDNDELRGWAKLWRRSRPNSEFCALKPDTFDRLLPFTVKSSLYGSDSSIPSSVKSEPEAHPDSHYVICAGGSPPNDTAEPQTDSPPRDVPLEEDPYSDPIDALASFNPQYLLYRCTPGSYPVLVQVGDSPQQLGSLSKVRRHSSADNIFAAVESEGPGEGVYSVPFDALLHCRRAEAPPAGDRRVRVVGRKQRSFRTLTDGGVCQLHMRGSGEVRNASPSRSQSWKGRRGESKYRPRSQPVFALEEEALRRAVAKRKHLGCNLKYSTRHSPDLPHPLTSTPDTPPDRSEPPAPVDEHDYCEIDLLPETGSGESDAKQSCLVEEGILKDSVPKGGEGEKKEFPLPLKVCKV